MDSIVAANLAAERSDRVVAAVLIGPVYPSDSAVPIFEKRIQQVEREGMQPMADTVPYAAPAKGASPMARAFIRELLLGQDAAGYCSNCRVIINAKPPAYSKISVPILIVAGEEDNSAPLAGCQQMFDEMGTSEKKLEVMKGVGHWQCVEAFEQVEKLILSFYHEIQ
ncbi:alpha/beta-hydrolase [Polyplosphaeria fusca]|uniref:Alpha/beta-hydrolase n=1 Tax=Polyplosphaeria fusca TaxID=682080 RepID=A0A9P4R9R6_9PLEO|nr:alpha/beta-hydrolase [Polyplosphaeria fusca]